MIAYCVAKVATDREVQARRNSPKFERSEEGMSRIVKLADAAWTSWRTFNGSDGITVGFDDVLNCCLAAGGE
jgi:hypothetical protein